MYFAMICCYFLYITYLCVYMLYTYVYTAVIYCYCYCVYTHGCMCIYMCMYVAINEKQKTHKMTSRLYVDQAMKDR